MFKTLIKKEFYQILKNFYVDTKTGKSISKSKRIGKFIGFAALMLVICALFFGMSTILAVSFLKSGTEWVYFAMVGIIAVILGVFGSVFSTYASLYLGQDNEILLSLPIPPQAVLASRLVMVYLSSLLYTGIVWLPAVVAYGVFGSPTVLAMLFSILLLFILPAFVSAITCILGWVVAAVASRMKNQNLIVAILSGIILVLYLFVSFNLSNIIQSIVGNLAAVEDAMQTWGVLFYELGRAATGNVIGMAIFTVIALALAVLCFWVLTKTFIKILMRGNGASGSARKKGSAKIGKKSDVKSALLRREFKRYTGNTTYMLNTGLGVIFLLVIAGFAIIKSGAISGFIADAKLTSGDLSEIVLNYVPIAIVFIVGFIVSMNTVATPSISLEGKTFWILRSLPVSSWDVMEAKENLQVLVNIFPALIAGLILSIICGLEIYTTVLVLCNIMAFVLLSAAFDLFLGLRKVNLNWTSPVQPIKQSISIFWGFLSGWIYCILMAVLFIPAMTLFSGDLYLAIWVIISLVLHSLVNHYLKTKGSVRFEKIGQ